MSNKKINEIQKTAKELSDFISCIYK